MTRDRATYFCRQELDKYGLTKWHVRLTTDSSKPFLGLCSYRDSTIILNAHHIDIHPDPDVIDTIRHEVAHALTPGQGHNEIWRQKAKELGCDSTTPCSNLSLSPEIIDAIRSGANITVTYEEEVHTIRRPKYEVTRLQDHCPHCKKVAVSLRETVIPIEDPTKPDLKMISLECGHTLVKKIPKGTPFSLLISNSGRDEVKKCKHEWTLPPGDITQCMKCREHRPYKFQTRGMEFIETALAVGKGCAVLDEMGLGKTIQALGYIKFHPEANPTLYIVKSKLRFQWFKQILIWIGDDHVAQIIQTGADVIIPGLKSYIMSFDIVVPKIRKSKTGKVIEQGFSLEKLRKANINTVIIDEAQHIKNPDSTRTQMIRKIVTDKFWNDTLREGEQPRNIKVIGLTGTPWKNRGSEFFSLLNMLAPMKFPSFERFKRDWVEYYIVEDLISGKLKRKEGGINNPIKFREYISDIAIRREREDEEVKKELQSAQTRRTKLYIQMSEVETGVYDEEVEKFVQWYNNAVIGGEELNSINILAQMARMRHLVALAKIPVTMEYIEDFVDETDKKIVIFAHHIDVQQLLYEECLSKFGPKTEYKIPVLKFTGGMSGGDVFTTAELFNSSKRAILVASSLSAGEGLNLQTCHDCIMHERQWNPANEEQMEGRFVRIGQLSDYVNAIYTEAEGSIDASFDEIVERKRSFFHAAMNKGEKPKWNESDIIKELAQVIVRKYKEKNRKRA